MTQNFLTTDLVRTCCWLRTYSILTHYWLATYLELNHNWLATELWLTHWLTVGSFSCVLRSHAGTLFLNCWSLGHCCLHFLFRGSEMKSGKNFFWVCFFFCFFTAVSLLFTSCFHVNPELGGLCPSCHLVANWWNCSHWSCWFPTAVFPNLFRAMAHNLHWKNHKAHLKINMSKTHLK